MAVGARERWCFRVESGWGRGFSATLTAKRAERPSGTRGLRRVFAPAWPGGRNSGQLLNALTRSSPL
jgi:hypothetical protein